MADGHYVRPVVVSSLFIYSGEKYSVLVTADQDPSRNNWAASHVVGRKRETRSTMAVLNYAGNDPRAPPPGRRGAQGGAEQVRRRGAPLGPRLCPCRRASPDRSLLLLNANSRIDDHERWAINGVSLRFPATPYLV